MTISNTKKYEFLIYCLTNKVNGKKYVGQTTRSIKKRWEEHCKTKKEYIGKSIGKHGKENFQIEILEECFSIDKLNEREIFWIKKLKTIDKRIGYNLQLGGLGGRHSEESKKKMSKSQIIRNAGGKNHYMYGEHHSEETKKKMSISRMGRISWNKGKKCPQISKALKGKIPWNKGNKSPPKKYYKKVKERRSMEGENNPMYGKHHSEETKIKMRDRRCSEEQKRKMSEFRTGKRLSEETKRKLSEMFSGKNNSFFGKHHSEETKRKMRGGKCSEETRNKMRLNRKDTHGKNNPMYGKRHSKETRKKMSMARLSRKSL